MKDAGKYTRIHYKKYYDRALKRARKFSLVLERLISPEGTFPGIRPFHSLSFGHYATLGADGLVSAVAPKG